MNALLEVNYEIKQKVPANTLTLTEIVDNIEPVIKQHNYYIVRKTGHFTKFDGPDKAVARHDAILYIHEGRFELFNKDEHTMLKLSYTEYYASEAVFIIFPVMMGLLVNYTILIIAVFLVLYMIFIKNRKKQTAKEMMQAIVDNQLKHS